jgi:tetratricopeptide repeat protein
VRSESGFAEGERFGRSANAKQQVRQSATRNIGVGMLGAERSGCSPFRDARGRALATVLNDQGDFAGARPLCERALAIREKVLGPEHSATNAVRSNLSRLLLLTGVLTEALALGKTALAAHDKALGRDHPWTKDSARVTADALDALGRTDEAKALRERYGVTSSNDAKSS